MSITPTKKPFETQRTSTTPWFSFEAAELLNEPENIATCLNQAELACKFSLEIRA
jgi:hypothetical protein